MTNVTAVNPIGGRDRGSLETAGHGREAEEDQGRSGELPVHARSAGLVAAHDERERLAHALRDEPDEEHDG